MLKGGMFMSKKILAYSSALFVYPSFLKGVARSIDLFGLLDEYNYSETENEADVKSLKRDWDIIGKDLWSAVKEYESETGQQFSQSAK